MLFWCHSCERCDIMWQLRFRTSKLRAPQRNLYIQIKYYPHHWQGKWQDSSTLKLQRETNKGMTTRPTATRTEVDAASERVYTIPKRQTALDLDVRVLRRQRGRLVWFGCPPPRPPPFHSTASQPSPDAACLPQSGSPAASSTVLGSRLSKCSRTKALRRSAPTNKTLLSVGVLIWNRGLLPSLQSRFSSNIIMLLWKPVLPLSLNVCL
jgi:hypothetical protein